MAPRTALSTHLRAWKCPQCAVRGFAATAKPQAIGPESPHYVPIRKPPQPGDEEVKFIKGRLPIPRDIFGGRDAVSDKSTNAFVARATPKPSAESGFKPAKGSREEWKVRMADMRRQNLREGIQALHARKTKVETRLREKSKVLEKERRRLLYKPEREEDRLTTPSHGLDLHQLLKGGVLPDPTREARFAFKKENYEIHEAQRREERYEAINKLYLHARDFIVTPQQLDSALEKAFGTDEEPVEWVPLSATDRADRRSIWARGAPTTVKYLLENNRPPSDMNDNPYQNKMTPPAAVNEERITRIAEVLTGGKIDTQSRKSSSRF